MTNITSHNTDTLGLKGVVFFALDPCPSLCVRPTSIPRFGDGVARGPCEREGGALLCGADAQCAGVRLEDERDGRDECLGV